MSEMYRTIHGSAHDIPLPDGSVQCIVTSPPYWGLRAYAGAQGVEWPAVTYRLNEWTGPVTVAGCDPDCAHEWQDGPVVSQQPQRDSPGGFHNSQSRGEQANTSGKAYSTTQGAYCRKCGGWRGGLGLEPDPVAYIGHLILCLREWRRILRDDGVAFVNLGDSYSAASTHAGKDKAGIHARGEESAKALRGRSAGKFGDGLKQKDLCGIPWLFAMAARADGWWLRSAVTWVKGNPMPESVRDRPTKATEMVFLLAKSAKYFYDNDAVREFDADAVREGRDAHGGEHPSLVPKLQQPQEQQNRITGRNMRDWWLINTQPTPFAHFATFPEAIPEKCIKAGTSARGCCPECGAPYERVVERTNASNWTGRVANGASSGSMFNGHNASHGEGMSHDLPPRETTITGWRPTCECDTFGSYQPQPCTVLDPFVGSGTTMIVALRLGRKAIGVDISSDYLNNVMAERFKEGAQIGMGL